MSEPGLVEIKSRISGVFYRGPDPSAPPFVQIGSRVDKGHTLALLESMKLFSKIKAPVAGEVVEIVGVHGEPVLVGQTLFSIRPAS